MSVSPPPLHTGFVEYWDRFYSTKEPMEPSNFAKYVAGAWFPKPVKLLEIGCGNGRDSVFFASLGHQVTGLDLSARAIEQCQKQCQSATFVRGDFSRFEFDDTFDVVYSRFTLHSVDDETEKLTLANVYRHLKPGGLFVVEARSIYDELCGRGERITDREWIYNNHYRRFLDPADFLNHTRAAGFQPAYMLMAKGLAPWEDLDPVVIRMVLKK